MMGEAKNRHFGGESVTNVANTTDDLFDVVLRQRSLAPPGQYAAVLATATPFATARTEGHELVLRVVEGTHTGRDIKLRLITDGAAAVDGLIASNVEVLRQWWREVGAVGRPSRHVGFGPVFETLRRFGHDKKLLFTVGLRGEGRFVENSLLAVEWDLAGEMGLPL
jgi:hypothetical protein